MKLEMDVTRVFADVSKNIKRINLLRGSTRSSKSFSLMQLVFLWLMTGRVGKHHIPTGNFLIIRATMPALRATVMKDWNNYLIAQNVYSRIDHRKTNNTYAYNNRIIEFLSVDDEEKLKGRDSSLYWVNESDAVSFTTFMSLLMRCKKFAFLDINPSNPDSWIKSRLEDERMITRGDVNLDISTYKDNPYLNPEMIKEIEGLKTVDYELWQIYTLGKWTKLSGRIITNWDVIDDIDYPEDLKIGYGLDFGFTNDPTALIRCAYDLNENILYCHEVIYKTGLLNTDIIDIINENCAKGDPIVADSAEPKSIRELQMAGVRCIPALKGKDSVKHGLQKLRQMKILITASSINLKIELERYKWQVDAFGKPTNKPIDKYSHGCDSLRYYSTKAVNKIKIS